MIRPVSAEATDLKVAKFVAFGQNCQTGAMALGDGASGKSILIYIYTQLGIKFFGFFVNRQLDCDCDFI